MSASLPVTPLLASCQLSLKASRSSCGALRAMIDQRRTGAEGGRVVRREWRVRKLAVVVAVQNLMVAACLLVTLYVYWDVRALQPASGENVHIEFGAISSISQNATLQFDHIDSMNKMSLTDKVHEKINVNCTGPYILYLYVCYKSMSGNVSNGILQLQVVGSQTPVSTFKLQVLLEVCRGLYSIAYLRAKEQAQLSLYAGDDFKIKNVTVGLSYLLGTRCRY